MLKKSDNIIDFGFQPAENSHHFLVYQKTKKEDVFFFEEYSYTEKRSLNTLMLEAHTMDSSCKCMLKAAKWDSVKDDIKSEFNRRLRSMDIRPSKWSAKETYLHRLLGKEMMVLVWAIEDADPNLISTAVHNWLGLRAEERWWLYTMANAATGHVIKGRNKGWRKALRFALTENPVNYNLIADHLDPLDDSDEGYTNNNLFKPI
ncbi:MAG: DUF3780 domain-containing protein [Candidatus Cyclonatronum sp.]|uniref:DUF3780 domain-containing protein n=1 Tax=Cyclonatronum sp. TaxID=3024185 RepID=UPI0025C46FE5|nr:DUF3780 domain-containing protein [Cyclonatronum sp.]MCH8487762.1 DUF3780 domain-containing protein [Cyclonatronum sp.]